MSGILAGYSVMQQAEWSGRRFFCAQDRRTGQVVYLVAAPVSEPLGPYQHAALPHVQPLAVESDVRWLVGTVSEGDTLEDLRNNNQLSESDLVSALLSVVDGTASLAALPSPPVPSYLDPACIRRDRLGRWTLDYLALAHAPEARSAASEPYGIHPFGILLYWLLTGQTVRRSRVQLQRVEGVSPALQFVLIKCLGKSYPSLAELRTDIERAGQEHEFRQLIHKRPARPGGILPAPRPIKLPLSHEEQPQPSVTPAEREHLLTHIPVIPMNEPQPGRPTGPDYHRVPLGGPQIPMDDRPWALPPRPAEGYRKYVVPPPPNPAVVKAIRWGSLGLVSLATCFLAGAVMFKAGIFPPDLLPQAWRTQKTVARMPGVSAPGGQIGQELPPPGPPGPVAGPVLPGPVQAEPPEQTPPQQEPPEEEPPKQEPPPAAPPSSPPPVSQPPPKTPAPPPVTQPPPAPPIPPQPVPIPPTNPGRPQPEPGSTDELDAKQGGLPVIITFNNRRLGWAYIVPHPVTPHISIATFNRLFGRNYFWRPQEGGTILLVSGTQTIITSDATIVDGRLWLKLTPFLQEATGIRVNTYTDSGMSFSSMP